MRIVNATALRVGDVISTSGKEEDAEKVLAIQKKSGYSPIDDEVVQFLTDKGWVKVGRDSQVPVLRQAAE